MSSVKEARVTRHITDFLKRLKAEGAPIWWFKVHGGPMQYAGVPDLLIVYRGRALGVEIKRPGGKPTRLQEHTLGRMAQAGATTAVVRSVTELEQVLGMVQ